MGPSVRPSVRPSVPEISETALRIFPKLGTITQHKNVRILTGPDFSKKFFFIRNSKKRDFLRGFSAFSRKLL